MSTPFIGPAPVAGIFAYVVDALSLQPIAMELGSGTGSALSPFISTLSCCVGVAGMPGGGVMSIQGVEGGSPLPVAPSPNTQAITVTTSSGYSAGDVVGGVIELLTVNAAPGRRVALSSLQINDASGSAVPFHIYFFKIAPAGGTYTDNDPLVWGAGDNANIVQSLDCQAADYLTDAGQSTVGYSSENMDCGVAATTLFVVLVAQDDSAGIGSGNLTLSFNFSQH